MSYSFHLNLKNLKDSTNPIIYLLITSNFIISQIQSNIIDRDVVPIINLLYKLSKYSKKNIDKSVINIILFIKLGCFIAIRI
jgi:hypothetical protein